jgi:exopolysaccharide biosynthesis polyprenyl glycosylphosphotransferase
MQSLSTGISTDRRRMLHTLLAVALDSLAMVVSFEIARWARGQSHRSFANSIDYLRFTAVMFATVPLWILIFAICGLYSVRADQGKISEAGRVVAAVVGGVMLLISIDYLSFDFRIFPSRSVPLIALLVAILLVILGRQLVRLVMRDMFIRGRGLHNVILIGTGEVALRIAAELTSPGKGYRLVAAVDAASDGDRMGSVPIFTSVEQAMAAHPEHDIDEIVLADLDLPRAEAARQMSFANARGIGYRFVPDRYGVYAAASTMATINGVPVMEVRLTSLTGWGALGKRVFDAIGAAILLIFFSPIMLALAIAVKICEPDGPVFYTQQRLGLNGRLIGVKKFRSMSWRYSTGPDREFATAEAAFIAMGREDLIPEFELTHKVLDDPRVSRLGKFLRSTSLDELPQLYNALRGDLSLVGPRPITQAELNRYGEQAMSFLALKPGITGLWQVYGRSSTTYEERVKLDIFYVENWSIGMDVSILARTLVSVTARRGAA